MLVDPLGDAQYPFPLVDVALGPSAAARDFRSSGVTSLTTRLPMLAAIRSPFSRAALCAPGSVIRSPQICTNIFTAHSRVSSGIQR